MGYIYRITHRDSDKSYIGQAINPTRRWGEHARGKQKSIISEAIRKQGIEAFDFFIIERCDDRLMNERERHWILEYNTHLEGYNHSLITRTLAQDDEDRRFGLDPCYESKGYFDPGPRNK